MGVRDYRKEAKQLAEAVQNFTENLNNQFSGIPVDELLKEPAVQEAIQELTVFARNFVTSDASVVIDLTPEGLRASVVIDLTPEGFRVTVISGVPK